MQHLLERFGEPIGDAVDVGEGVADERNGKPKKGEASNNRGWCQSIDESTNTCSRCGDTLEMDEVTCSSCGETQEIGVDIDESERGGRHPGHASSCTCPDCQPDKNVDESDSMDQIAPPGGRKVVKALKRQNAKKGSKKINPYAVAWSMKNKGEI
jgi:hypothetical protein